MSVARRSTSGRSRSWCWTKRTGCSTWASSTTSSACWRCCRQSGRPCCSAPRSPIRSERSPRRSARAPASASRSRGGTAPSMTVTQVRSTKSIASHKTELLAELIRNMRRGLEHHVRWSLRERSTGRTSLPGSSARGPHGGRYPPATRASSARQRALANFKRGAVRVLVATDMAARGLDIDGLPHVVNFELPNVAEDYVHRIGRTGRAGTSGGSSVPRMRGRTIAAARHRTAARLRASLPASIGNFTPSSEAPAEPARPDESPTISRRPGQTSAVPPRHRAPAKSMRREQRPPQSNLLEVARSLRGLEPVCRSLSDSRTTDFNTTVQIAFEELKNDYRKCQVVQPGERASASSRPKVVARTCSFTPRPSSGRGSAGSPKGQEDRVRDRCGP